MKDYTVVLTGNSDFIPFICGVVEDSIIEIHSKDMEDFLGIFNRTTDESMVVF